MAQLQSICQFLDTLLEPHLYSDLALNGLQVEATSPEANIQKIAVAVDAGQSVIESAITWGANILIVHHGIYWGRLQPITGILGRKIRTLVEGRCSLYASHLPLDGHREVGNGFELARYVDLRDIDGFFEIDGRTVGAHGVCSSPETIDFFLEKLASLPGAVRPVVFPFGPSKIERVAIVTGSGAQAIPLCDRGNGDRRFDLLISGEPKQEAYHSAKETGVNVIFAGHYATETFGVRALGARLKDRFDIETRFIDEPTGV